jgi:glycosyltransferase involved in cell wall biosynthesis
LSASADFMQQHPDSRFVCVGDGPVAYRRELEVLAQSQGLGGRILWAGEVGASRAIYNAFDVATLSSAFGEGFPNAVGEAMACGIPVVATNVGDVGLILGDCGEVVPPRQPDGLSAAWARMREILRQDGENLRTAVRARIVQYYGVDTMVDRSEHVLSELCAGRAPAAIAEHYT